MGQVAGWRGDFFGGVVCIRPLHSLQVEDLTGQGLQDLRAGIIRTPLHPMETFLDGEWEGNGGEPIM